MMELSEGRMSNSSTVVAARIRPGHGKQVLWIGIAVISLVVLVAVEVPLFSSPSPHRAHLLAQNLILIPHAVSGLVAFLIGPLQFSTRLRQRNLGLHRILGKAYVIAIFISVPSALILGNALPNPLKIAADSQAVLWFICTAAGFVTARNRHIVQHPVWMIRSYSVTLVFFTSRVLLPIPAYGNMGPQASRLLFLFCSLLPSLSPRLHFIRALLPLIRTRDRELRNHHEHTSFATERFSTSTSIVTNRSVLAQLGVNTK